ncbi:hypothetical protein Asppvi_010410 [Aspergillus pseudoviridinutans]|uniref:Uncharacterized protein n=1 Tax=Aspergillus pseudoviridinutans TaxID=1517512 RepID=A0A9P3BHN1_9EURO|nr:uncharacterized protein Asppvi_010410 [Aspergillus pseudoviridinutans]GIJ91445.1 hypothetical protein Asppvi_010410 [Aspergillus pseudoviridinutans]
MKQRSSIQEGLKGPENGQKVRHRETPSERSKEPHGTRSGNRDSVLGSWMNKIRPSRGQQPSPISVNHRRPTPSARSNQQSVCAEPRDGRRIENARPSRTESEYIWMIKEKDACIQKLRAEYIESVREYEARIADYTRRMEEQERHITELEQERTNLEKDLDILRNERQRLESVALVAQEGALKAMAKGGHVPKEDRVIRDELTRLQDAVRQWARKYAVEAMADIDGVPSQQKDQVIKHLKGYCIQTRWSDFLLKAPIPSNKIPFVLVEALLAKHIFDQMFMDPFFLFPESSDGSTLPGRANMRLLYDAMKQADQAKAHMWRSQIISVLSDSMQSRLQEFARVWMSAFLRSPAQLLLHTIADESGLRTRSAELQKLYHRAGKLALSLWAQRASIKCYGLSQLQTFSSSSPMMSAHRLHQLDEDDECLDGRKVLACMQPAILAFGNESGENYETSKVWASAVVLVAEDE